MNTIQQHILLLTHKLKTWKSGDFDPNVPSTSGINDRSLVPYADDENITPNEIIERIEELQGLLEEIMSERQIQVNLQKLKSVLNNCFSIIIPVPSYSYYAALCIFSLCLKIYMFML